MKILITEDDKHISKSLAILLKKQNHNIKIAHSAKETLQSIKNHFFDIILLKYQLPDANGIELCYDIRKELVFTPIIFLTKRADIETKLSAFSAGVNDYIVKPFSLLELIARINVHELPIPSQINQINMRGLSLYPSKNIIRCKDKQQEIKLTNKEMTILLYLIKNSNKIVSRKELLTHLYPNNTKKSLNLIDVYISNLRKKLSKNFCPIETVPSKGYVIFEK